MYRKLLLAMLDETLRAEFGAAAAYAAAAAYFKTLEERGTLFQWQAFRATAALLAAAADAIDGGNEDMAAAAAKAAVMAVEVADM
jgi:hypothetical protein